MGSNPNKARCCSVRREEGSYFLKVGKNERVRAGLGVLGTLWASLRSNRPR